MGLTNEQKRLVEKYYEGFENSGATLSAEGKEKYRALSMELSRAWSLGKITYVRQMLTRCC